MIDQRFIGRQYIGTAYEVGREKIREYARAVGDLNALYLDKESGKSSKYGDMIAPPLFACVCFMPVFDALCQDEEVFPDINKAVWGEQEFKFLEVIKPGDIMTTEGKITDIYRKQDMDFVVFEMILTNQRGQQVVICRSTFIARQ